MIRARRRQRIRTRFGGEEQLLDVGLPSPLQSPPLGIGISAAVSTPLGHDLWSFRHAPF